MFKSITVPAKWWSLPCNNIPSIVFKGLTSQDLGFQIISWPPNKPFESTTHASQSFRIFKRTKQVFFCFSHCFLEEINIYKIRFYKPSKGSSFRASPYPSHVQRNANHYVIFNIGFSSLCATKFPLTEPSSATLILSDRGIYSPLFLRSTSFLGSNPTLVFFLNLSFL